MCANYDNILFNTSEKLNKLCINYSKINGNDVGYVLNRDCLLNMAM